VGAADQLGREVAVRLKVEPLVSVIPDQFFFGVVTPGSQSSQTVLVRFALNSIPAAEGVRINHDLGGQLEVAWQSTEGQHWILKAVFHPNCTF
jgi:hypothetical protein